MPRTPTFTAGSIGALNYISGSFPGKTYYYGSPCAIGGSGEFGNVIDGVCYYINVGYDDTDEFGLADTDLENTVSSLSANSGVPLYPNANMAWISKMLKPDKSDRRITLYSVEGTFNGGFTQTDSSKRTVALPLLQNVTSGTIGSDIPDYVIASVAYDPF